MVKDISFRCLSLYLRYLDQTRDQSKMNFRDADWTLTLVRDYFLILISLK